MNALQNFAKAVLVHDWREAWKWLSMWFAAALVVWSQMPVNMQNSILSLFGLDMNTLTGIIGAAIMLGRLLNQPSTPSDAKE